MRGIVLIYCCLHLLVPVKCQKLNKKKPDGRRESSGLIPYIIGGVEVPITLYPHVAMYTYKGLFRCGGSIISDRVVLTAAHCFRGASKVIEVADYDVYLGSSIAKSGTKYKVCKIVQHEDYGKMIYYAYDIAVMLLRSMIIFSKTVQKINIAPHRRWRKSGYSFTLAGFGFHVDFTTNGEPKGASEKLKATRMQFVDSEACNRSVTDDGAIIPVFEYQFCMISTKWSSDCDGDSGFGVIWKNKYLVGMVSLGRSTYCASDTMPSMYVDAVYFKKWITDHIKDLESQPVDQICPLKIYQLR